MTRSLLGLALITATACSNPSDDAAPPDSPPATHTGGADSTAAPDDSRDNSAEPASPQAVIPVPTTEPQRASDASFEADSLHVLVNPLNPLDPVDYEPETVPVTVQTSTETELRLREDAAEALAELFAGIQADNMTLAMTSGYRSYDAQQRVYEELVFTEGTEGADEVAARPGYSEHQTGLAADVISIDNPNCIQGYCFADTPEGQWVADHAHEYGFIIRYQQDMEHITGFTFEPWHLRYVGEDTAQEVTEAGLTLEEYWEQPPAPDYDQDLESSTSPPD